MKKTIIIIAAVFLSCMLFAQEEYRITNTPAKGFFKPLELVKFELPEPANIIVKDAHGHTYFTKEAETEAAFFVSGFPGVQSVLVFDKRGALLHSEYFTVKCETSINDNEGEWNQLFKLLKWNLYKPMEFKIVRYNNQPYFLLSDWLRDHVNILKGKKYFFSEIKDCINLFAENQHENGMIFDFYMPADENFWEDRFSNKDFIDLRLEEGHVFERVPVENDVEFWFVMGLYQTWKASDDDIWMNKWLPAAEKALQYNLSSEYVWSEKYQLLKRPLTIDTWDFMPSMDAAVVGGDVMESIPEKSRYGIMHGDNTGFAAACRMLAEMYEYNGDSKKAQHWRLTADEILERLERVSWNGNFYTHFIDETENIERDLGVDMNKQVSLSNTYALNRGISHEKAVKIIETYQEIRRTMPETSPGEFYGIYPPFQNGFHFQPWHYVNGGVFPFIAGELSKGSFNHGYEEYGVDILLRIKNLLEKNDGEFPYYWIGKIPERPETNFQPVSIIDVANVDFLGKGAEKVPGWTGEGMENDLSDIPTGRRVFHGVPFDIIDPGSNGRKACLGLASKKPYKKSDTIMIGKKAKSIYFLHTMAGHGGMAGWIDFIYSDSTMHRKYVNSGKELKNWWGPKDGSYSRANGWSFKKAWSYHNGKANVGVYTWGYDNPHPEKSISKIIFNHSMEPSKWFVLGLTLSDQPSYFEWPWAHGNWLVNWNTGCLMNAYIEGLAGIQDIGVSYDSVKVCPRWSATTINEVSVTAKYEASGSYFSYKLKKADDKISLRIAGVAEKTEIELLLPHGKSVDKVRRNGTSLDFAQKKVENSSYVTFFVRGNDYKEIMVHLK